MKTAANTIAIGHKPTPKQLLVVKFELSVTLRLLILYIFSSVDYAGGDTKSK